MAKLFLGFLAASLLGSTSRPNILLEGDEGGEGVEGGEDDPIIVSEGRLFQAAVGGNVSLDCVIENIYIQCRASNGVGDSVRERTSLEVTCKF